MKKILNKLSYKLIIPQILFLYFFSNAAKRFYYTWHSELFECFYKSRNESGMPCFEKYHLQMARVSDFLVEPVYMMLFGLLIATVITAIVNRIRKKSVFNTLLVLILYVILFLIGIFRFTNDLDSFLLRFAQLFTHQFWTMNFIVVQIYFVTAVLLLWVSIRSKKTPKHSRIQSE